MPGYRHAMVVEAGMKETFRALDFDTAQGMKVAGDYQAVGVLRSVTIPGGAVIEERQIRREVNDQMSTLTYNMEGNPWEVKGYISTITVYSMSEEANRCFVEWKATWDSNGPKAPDLEKMIGKNLHGVANKLGKSSKM